MVGDIASPVKIISGSATKTTAKYAHFCKRPYGGPPVAGWMFSRK